jgi:hypothetical protein
LLSNALYVAISISIKLQVEILGCLIFLLWLVESLMQSWKSYTC